MFWNLFCNKVAGQAYTYTEKETSGQVVAANFTKRLRTRIL